MRVSTIAIISSGLGALFFIFVACIMLYIFWGRILSKFVNHYYDTKQDRILHDNSEKNPPSELGSPCNNSIISQKKDEVITSHHSIKSTNTSDHHSSVSLKKDDTHDESMESVQSENKSNSQHEDSMSHVSEQEFPPHTPKSVPDNLNNIKAKYCIMGEEFSYPIPKNDYALSVYKKYTSLTIESVFENNGVKNDGSHYEKRIDTAVSLLNAVMLSIQHTLSQNDNILQHKTQDNDIEESWRGGHEMGMNPYLYYMLPPEYRKTSFSPKEMRILEQFFSCVCKEINESRLLGTRTDTMSDYHDLGHNIFYEILVEYTKKSLDAAHDEHDNRIYKILSLLKNPFIFMHCFHNKSGLHKSYSLEELSSHKMQKLEVMHQNSKSLQNLVDINSDDSVLETGEISHDETISTEQENTLQDTENPSQALEYVPEEIKVCDLPNGVPVVIDMGRYSVSCREHICTIVQSHLPEIQKLNTLYDTTSDMTLVNWIITMASRWNNDVCCSSHENANIRQANIALTDMKIKLQNPYLTCIFGNSIDPNCDKELIAVLRWIQNNMAIQNCSFAQSMFNFSVLSDNVKVNSLAALSVNKKLIEKVMKVSFAYIFPLPEVWHELLPCNDVSRVNYKIVQYPEVLEDDDELKKEFEEVFHDLTKTIDNEIPDNTFAVVVKRAIMWSTFVYNKIDTKAYFVPKNDIKSVVYNSNISFPLLSLLITVNPYMRALFPEKNTRDQRDMLLLYHLCRVSFRAKWLYAPCKTQLSWAENSMTSSRVFQDLFQDEEEKVRFFQERLLLNPFKNPRVVSSHNLSSPVSPIIETNSQVKDAIDFPVTSLSTSSHDLDPNNTKDLTNDTDNPLQDNISTTDSEGTGKNLDQFHYEVDPGYIKMSTAKMKEGASQPESREITAKPETVWYANTAMQNINVGLPLPQEKKIKNSDYEVVDL